MHKPTQHQTLREYGGFLLAHADNLTTAGVKSIPFAGRNPVTGEPTSLVATSIAELAQVLLFTLGLSYMDKKKTQLTKAMALPPADQAAELAQLEASWPLQVLVRKSDGTPDLDKTSKLPRLEVDAKKLGTVLQQGDLAALVNNVDLAAPQELKAIVEAISSRATHPVKLSVDSGASRADVKGGFVKVDHIRAAVGFAGSVSEQDYLVDATPALTCSASYQSKDWLALTRVFYEGQEQVLCDRLNRDEALRAQLLDELTKDSRVQGAAQLLGILGTAEAAGFSGEPQVFCGDSQKMHALAPLMPLSLLGEALRAKNSLREMHDAGDALEAEKVAAQIVDAQAKVEALKAAAKSKDKVEKATAKAQLEEAREAVATLKLRERALTKGFLSIPTFTLLFGGTTPRNLASGLSTAVHSAALFTRIRERQVRAAVSNKAFLPNSLVTEPNVEARKLPKAFAENTAAAKAVRKSFFAGLASAALQPLIALREAWDEPDWEAHTALYEKARAELDHGKLHDAVIGWFVKGDTGLTGTAAREAFKPLIADVCTQVRRALARAFPATAFGDFESELQEAACAVVLMERA